MDSIDISRLALELHACLAQSNDRIVFAESCTAGRLAAALASVPGASAVLCGSFVVYRNQSKTDWLGVSPALLADPKVGPVSAQASAALCAAVLKRTEEAGIALAVTGDIGPNAPAATDGQVFVCAARRDPPTQLENQIELEMPAPTGPDDLQARADRLDEATARVLSFAVEFLRGRPA